MQELALLLEPLKDSGPLFFALLIGHVMGDYPLQTEFMAIGKNHRRPLSGMAAETRGVWVHCLTAHALVHAGAVWMITGSMTLALIEAGLHWVIDFAKSAGLTNLHVDQILHILCKVGYVWAIHVGWVMAGG